MFADAEMEMEGLDYFKWIRVHYVEIIFYISEGLEKKPP